MNSKIIAPEEQHDPITAYFDEMNLLPSERKARIRTAREFQKRAHNFLTAQMRDLVLGLFLHEKSHEDYIDTLVDLYVAMVAFADKNAQYDTEVQTKAIRFAEYVEKTTEEEVTLSNMDDTFTSAVMLGTGIDERLIPGYLKNEIFDAAEWQFRSERIALYETNWIHNYLAHKEKVERGQLTHTWESQKDERVRGSHAVADMQTVPINMPFIVGGYQMLFPTDDSLGAPASEILGCRCIEL